MLHPSKRLLFAIESVLDIAYYGGSQPVQSGDISGRQGIPRRYLEQVLQHLVRSGILAGLGPLFFVGVATVATILGNRRTVASPSVNYAAHPSFFTTGRQAVACR